MYVQDGFPDSLWMAALSLCDIDIPSLLFYCCDPEDPRRKLVFSKLLFFMTKQQPEISTDSSLVSTKSLTATSSPADRVSFSDFTLDPSMDRGLGG